MSSRRFITPLVFLICLGWQTLSHGATFISYLLIQGPFGPSLALETQKWEVIYDEGTLTTGQDLLNAVFGTPTLSGTYLDGFGYTNNYQTSGNATQGAGYIDFGSGLFAESFTLHGTKIAQSIFYDPSWIYWSAGGSDGGIVNYSSGSWAYANSGPGSRLLANGSFDAFNFGTADWSATYLDPGTTTPISFGTTLNAPLTGSFTGAQVINLSVPEPGRLILSCLGGMALFWQRRRNGRSWK